MDPVMKAALQRDKVTIDPSLRLYIPFNEGTGSVAKDYSQYGNNGVLTDVKWGVLGGVFNGTSAYGDCGNDSSLDITDAITIEYWVNYISGSEFGLTKSWNKWRFYSNPLKIYNMRDGGPSNWNTGWSYTDNTWYHIAWTNTGLSEHLYINGILENSRDVTGTLDSSGNLYLASYPPSPDFNGSIDGVKIYNRALSALEILNDYEAERGVYGV